MTPELQGLNRIYLFYFLSFITLLTIMFLLFFFTLVSFFLFSFLPIFFFKCSPIFLDYVSGVSVALGGSAFLGLSLPKRPIPNSSSQFYQIFSLFLLQCWSLASHPSLSFSPQIYFTFFRYYLQYLWWAYEYLPYSFSTSIFKDQSNSSISLMAATLALAWLELKKNPRYRVLSSGVIGQFGLSACIHPLTPSSSFYRILKVITCLVSFQTVTSYYFFSLSHCSLHHLFYQTAIFSQTPVLNQNSFTKMPIDFTKGLRMNIL